MKISLRRGLLARCQSTSSISIYHPRIDGAPKEARMVHLITHAARAMLVNELRNHDLDDLN